MNKNKKPKDSSETKRENIPKARFIEDSTYFGLKNELNFPYLLIKKSEKSVAMFYPVKGAITQDAVRGIYCSERENSLELFLHFISQGPLDRLWCVGELEKSDREKAIDWTKRVNAMYKK